MGLQIALSDVVVSFFLLYYHIVFFPYKCDQVKASISKAKAGNYALVPLKSELGQKSKDTLRDLEHGRNV